MWGWPQLRALFLEGGLRVETRLPGPPAPGTPQNFATTLVQLDGDALTAVHRDYANRADLWALHHANLRRELGGIRRLQAALDGALLAGRVSFVPFTAYAALESVSAGLIAALPFLLLPLGALAAAFAKGIVFWYLKRALRRRNLTLATAR